MYKNDVGQNMQQEMIWKINTVRKSIFFEKHLFIQYRSIWSHNVDERLWFGSDALSQRIY